MGAGPSFAPLALGLLLAGAAQAGPRYQKTEVKVVAGGRHFTAAQRPVAKAAAPALAAEAFRHAIQSKVARLNDTAIATLKQLIKVTDENDAEKPDYFFRLAEHFRDKKSEYMFRARELDERIFVASTPAEKDRIKARQKQFEQLEQQWMLGAIKLYLTVANTPAYAKYPRMDEVLYNLADMLNQAKRHDRARVFFGELIRNYPQSRYLPDAYLSFAEHYFNEGDVEEALRRYEQVARYKDSALYGYAIYKQAWCWINLNDPRRALELFLRVIREGDQFAGTAKSKLMLVREAKKDLVRAYAMVGTPERAWPFFQRVGGDAAPMMLERLGEIYYDQGKFSASITIFKQLIGLQPQSASLCVWQHNIVRAALSGLGKTEQVLEVKRLAAVHELLRRQARLPASVVAQCRERAAGTLRELATLWHNEAQKTLNNDTYALAEQLYQQYLTSFPQEKDHYAMAFFYAELLFKLERWEQAADAYTVVVALEPRGKYLKESAYAAVIAWKNALNVAEEVKDHDASAPGEKFEPRPIPANQQKMLVAFDTYLKHVPDAPERPAILYRKARTYYEHNHFAEAVDGFAQVLEQYPAHELAVYAANLLLDALNILKRYDDIADWVERMNRIPQLATSELKETLARIRREIKRKQLEDYQERGRYRQCGEGYAQLASDYPDDARWPELAFNAALCFEAAKLIGQAISIRQKLIEVAPKDPLAQRAMYMIGANFHALAWYSRAAEWYERFAKEFPGEKEAPEALQNAIVFRLGRAEYELAQKDIEFFAKSYGKRPQYAARTAQVVFSLGQRFEQRNDLEGVIKYYGDYLRDWGRYGGVDRQIVAHVKIGRALWRASCPVGGLNGACIKMDRVRSKRTVRKAAGGKSRGVELRKQCGPETKNRITVVDRNGAKVRQAQGHLAEALTLGRRAGITRAAADADQEEAGRREQAMRHALAEARFLQAEAQLEAFLALEFPTDLDFSEGDARRKQASVRAFRKYLDSKGKLLERARQSYQDTIQLRESDLAIAAAARIGQLFQNFADALYTAPVPKPAIPPALRGGAARDEFVTVFTDAYCDTLEDKARPLEEKAVQGLDACLSKSTELSWYNEWSQLCEQELNQIKPAEYPMASEVRPEPGYLSARADRAGVITVIR
ncbi:MAG: tetratricopeptide repeat protein [Proteobacteria bacterium]|nr:tetratricopeptide repeat protein [Pseudomonadota bacterium]